MTLSCCAARHRIPLALGHHAEKVAPAHDPCSRDILERGFVDGERRRAGAVGTLAARAHNPAVEHVGDTHVLHVRVSAVDLGRHIHPRHARADELVLARRFPRRRTSELDIERFVADQFAIADRAVRFAIDRHHSARDDQAADLDTEALRGLLKERQARLGCRRPHLRPAALDRGTRAGGALFGRHIGVEPHARKLAHVQVELFAGDLQQARCVALPQLALAEIKRCGVVGVDCDPGIDGVGSGGPAISPRARPAGAAVTGPPVRLKPTISAPPAFRRPRRDSGRFVSGEFMACPPKRSATRPGSPS